MPAAATKKGNFVLEKMASVKTPVYYVSHGGPNIMEQYDHPAYAKFVKLGKEITQKVKPKAVVVFSAHWQGGRDTIEVNTAEDTDLIYDFYGFPARYFTEKFPHKGSKEIGERVISLLNAAGIKTKAKNRGLDHGVWACFKAAFHPERNPLNVPIVQASLFDNENPDQHYRLGQAISTLRSEGVQIIVSGSAVHNLYDLGKGLRNGGKALPYAVSFDNALRDAATAPPEERQAKMASLLKRSDARQAHPTFDHLLPIFIGAGAAGEDRGVQIWTMPEGSLSWAQYRFGDVPSEA